MDSGFFDQYEGAERRALLNSVATMGIARNALNKTYNCVNVCVCVCVCVCIYICENIYIYVYI